jgi:hypothetical protein
MAEIVQVTRHTLHGSDAIYQLEVEHWQSTLLFKLFNTFVIFETVGTLQQ